MKNHGDLVLPRGGKTFSRLLTSIKKDAGETMVNYFAPVTFVAKSIGSALNSSTPRHVKAASKRPKGR